MKHKLLYAVLSSSMVMGVTISSTIPVFASETVLSQTTSSNEPYNVQAFLKNAGNIANDSMAAGALLNNATLEMVDGTMYVTVEFQTLSFGGLKGNATNIQYYTDYKASTKVTPLDVTYRQVNGVDVEKTIKVPVTMNDKGTYGVYIQMNIDVMNMNVNAYVEIDAHAGVKAQLVTTISEASVYNEGAYTTSSYALLRTAIKNAQIAIDTNADVETLITCQAEIQTAIKALVKKQTVISLNDGMYTTTTQVYQLDGVTPSMANQAVKGASLQVTNNRITVDLQLGAVNVYGQTAYIDQIEYENPTTNTWEKATVTTKDDAGNVTGVRFILPENVEKTNVKFYYGGSSRGAQAILYVGLQESQPVQTSKFKGDGTYQVNVSLWHATSDQESMAGSAINKQAYVTVEKGKATMYISTKKMTMGTITAYLQELKIKTGNTYREAFIVSKDANNNPTMFAFELPNEETYIDVLVNPQVAIMGNQDIAARINVDYTSLTKQSDEIKKPTDQETTTTPETTTPDTTTPDVDKLPSAGNNTQTEDTTKTNTATSATTTLTSGPVATGDTTQLGFIGGLLITSCGVIYASRKKRNEHH